ncbi:MAG: hypothetical protein IPN81_11105 [Nitrosomonadales bacterium]|nr:hypothetical protein [Nitrosomonadales bacterium]
MNVIKNRISPSSTSAEVYNLPTGSLNLTNQRKRCYYPSISSEALIMCIADDKGDRHGFTQRTPQAEQMPPTTPILA